MKTNTLQKYMLVQKHRIEIDKWCEGIRINYDPGKIYVFEWIKISGSLFRRQWNESLCKNCRNWENCGYKVIKECNMFYKE